MSSLGKSFRLSSTLKIEEEAMVITKNQGIGSILRSDISDETSTKSSSSLRRTLSADMSSTKWLTQHGFSSPTTKRTASSEEFSICSIVDSSSSEAEEDEEDTETEQQSRFDIWSSIQDEAYKKKQQLDENKSQFDMWSSLIQQKSQQEPLPPPYIHPLVKRSASSLSKKSLEICTESLGSETGSACFSSSYPASDSGDATEEDDKENEPEQEEERVVEQSFENLEQEDDDNYYVAAAAKKSSPQRSFPPPIPSSCLDGASSIRMQSRRDNGRLVLEAVSVPFTNNFLAQRQDGRLVLTLSTEILKTEQEEEEEEEEKKEVEEESEEVFESLFDDEDNESDEGEEETEDGIKEGAFVMEQAPKFPWPNKFNDVVRFDEVEEDTEPAMVAKSLPPMARLIPKSTAVAATGTVMTTAALSCRGGGGGGASFNAYEYYRRPKSMTTQSEGNKNSTENNGEQQNLLVLRGNKGDSSLVPLVKSCKEPRRSLLCWEPYCIATS